MAETSPNILLSPGAFELYGAILIAFFVYLLGLKAYHKQKSFEQFQARYLSEGLDLWTSQCDYALGVFRRNWALMLRIVKQYREYDTTANADDFFEKFTELDYASFRIGPSSRIQSLIDSKVFWEAYQSIFAFVATSNDAMKADFGAGLKRMMETPNHPNKAGFINEAVKMSDEQNAKAAPLYALVSLMFQLSELLAKSNYSINDMHKFSKREDVIKKVIAMQEIESAKA